MKTKHLLAFIALSFLVPSQFLHAQVPKDMAGLIPEKAALVAYIGKPAKFMESSQRFLDASNLASMGLGNSGVLLDIASKGLYSNLKAYVDMESPIALVIGELEGDAYMVVKTAKADLLKKTAGNKLKLIGPFGSYIVIAAPTAKISYSFPLRKSLDLSFTQQYNPDAIVIKSSSGAELFEDAPEMVREALGNSIISLKLDSVGARVDMSATLGEALEAAVGLSLTPRSDAKAARQLLESLPASSPMSVVFSGKALDELSAWLVKNKQVLGAEDDTDFASIYLKAWQGKFASSRDWALVLQSNPFAGSSDLPVFGIIAALSLTDYGLLTKKAHETMIPDVLSCLGITPSPKLVAVESRLKLSDGTSAVHWKLDASDTRGKQALEEADGECEILDNIQSFAAAEGGSLLIGPGMFGEQNLSWLLNASRTAIKTTEIQGARQTMELLPAELPILMRIPLTHIMGSGKIKPHMPGLFAAFGIQKGSVRISMVLAAREIAWAVKQQMESDAEE